MAASAAVKYVPLKVPGKYWLMLPPSGAPGLMLICKIYISSLEAKLVGSKGLGIEAFLSMGTETRLGHSYCRPKSPACVKLEACVQLIKFGDVKMPITKSWAYEITATLYHAWISVFISVKKNLIVFTLRVGNTQTSVDLGDNPCKCSAHR